MTLAAFSYAVGRKTDCPYERLVLMAVCDGMVDGYTDVSPRGLAEWSCLSEDDAVNVLFELEEQGVLTANWDINGTGSFLTVHVHALIREERRTAKPTFKPVPPSVRKAVYERDDRTCHYCGTACEDGNISLDHVVPQSSGGGHSPDNLVVACRSCNSSKGTKSYDDFVEGLH